MKEKKQKEGSIRNLQARQKRRSKWPAYSYPPAWPAFSPPSPALSLAAGNIEGLRDESRGREVALT